MPSGSRIGPDIEIDALRRHARLEADGRVADVRRERFGVQYTEAGMLRLMKGLDLPRRKTRPHHPQSDPAARRDFRKGGRRER